jgi:hypothetical protein
VSAAVTKFSRESIELDDLGERLAVIEQQVQGQPGRRDDPTLPDLL